MRRVHDKLSNIESELDGQELAVIQPSRTAIEVHLHLHVGERQAGSVERAAVRAVYWTLRALKHLVLD